MATLSELSQAIGGELHGPPDTDIGGVASLQGAGAADLAPVDTAPFVAGAHESKAGALLVNRKLAGEFERPRILHDYPLVALNRVIEILGLIDTTVPRGIHETAVVEGELGPDAYVGPFAVIQPGARIGARCRVSAHAVIESDVEIGDDCVVGAHAVILDGARLGDRVRVDCHAVVSRLGFGYAPGPGGPVLLHHIGTTVLEDNVHIGAGTMVDRARFDETRIGTMTALDNLIHIGHNARIGARTFVAAQTGLAGRASVGNDCLVAGQVGIANDCGVGDKSTIAAKSGLIALHPDNSDLFWYPARPRRKVLRALGRLFRGLS